MITLPKTFVSGDGGFSAAPLHYTQLQRTESVALYRRDRPNGHPLDWEVFNIRIQPKGLKIFNAPPTEDDEEKYAITSSFGKNAWSCATEDHAYKRFAELCKIATAPEIVKEAVIIPDGEFSVKEFGEKNNMEYPEASNLIKEGIASGTIVFTRAERRNAKGKPTNLYAKAGTVVTPSPAPIIPTSTSKQLLIPVGEWTIGELAEKNKIDYAPAFIWMKEALSKNLVRFIREERRNQRGKPSKIYTKV